MKCPKCDTVNPDDSKYCKECAVSLTVVKDISFTWTLKAPVVGFSKGTVIADKYKIIQKIGEGGMGIVYKAKDTRLDRTVALKFLSSELTRDQEAKQRFVQEAKAAAALNHPNITTIYEIDEHQGKTFIAMEFISGQSLKQRLEEGPIAIEEAKDLAIQVAEGLKEAHAKGIIHRDIKPANIMFTEKGQAKVTDFGLAKLSGGADLTKASTIMGTVAYMSPEQAKGEAVDHRTDIWSLGVMMYEMLTGTRPFKKDQEHALIYSILNDEPQSISSFRPDIQGNFGKIVNNALAKNVHLRYQNIIELLNDLEVPAATSLAESKKSIAVLPFTNMSADSEQEYFCDGMTEEIINALTHFSELRVVARTSVFSYKGKDTDIREIGEKLNVGKVLEGSVRKAGDRLRIMVQLINVADGYHIWSERYDRNIGDVFEIQDEITLAIIKKLKVNLLEKEKETLARHGTEDVEAYNLYLKGRYIFWNMLTPDSIDQSMKYYYQALEKQPNYALAYAGLAQSYNCLGWYALVPPKEIFPEAEKAANKALEINDSIGEAYRELAYTNIFYHFNWSEGEKNCKRALEINPNSSNAHLYLSHYFLSQSRLDEGLDRVKRAQGLDPLSLALTLNLGVVYYFRRETDKAMKEFKEILDLNPNFYVARSFLGCAYEQIKKYEKAIKEFQAALDLGGGTYDLSRLGSAYGLAGERSKAQKILNDLKKQGDQGYVSPYDIARIYMGFGERDQALAWLEKAWEDRTSWLGYLNIDPCFEALQTDSRFIELKGKIGFDS